MWVPDRQLILYLCHELPVGIHTTVPITQFVHGIFNHVPAVLDGTEAGSFKSRWYSDSDGARILYDRIGNCRYNTCRLCVE